MHLLQTQVETTPINPVTGDRRSPTALPSPLHVGVVELLLSVVALQQKTL